MIGQTISQASESGVREAAVASRWCGFALWLAPRVRIVGYFHCGTADVTDRLWSVEDLVALWEATNSGGRKQQRKCEGRAG